MFPTSKQFWRLAYDKPETMNGSVSRGLKGRVPKGRVRPRPGRPRPRVENSSKYHQTLNGRLPLEDRSDFDDPVLVLIVMT